MNTNEKGDVAELRVVLRAREMGIIVSKPMCDSSRYDLIFDDGKTLKKVQVKWASGRSGDATGSAYVELRRQNRKGGGLRVYQDGEIDYLIVYLPEPDIFCLFPPEVFVGKRGLAIRFKTAKNNQNKGCLFAREFLW